jgi:hypothetical protein
MSRPKLPPMEPLRTSFKPEGTEPGADAFLAECRQLALTADPSLAKDVTEAELVQTTVSLAVQRILHWAQRHRGDSGHPDDIPTHALLGVVTAVGMGAALFSYDPDDVARTSAEVIRRSWRRTVDYELDRDRSGPKGPWDA